MAEDTQGNRDTLERRMDGVTWSAEGPTNPAPRTIPTEKVDRMRERCGLDKDFPGVHRGRKGAENTGSRGTGRTTLMLLHALVAYDEGRTVAIVGQAYMQQAWTELLLASGICERATGPRFIEYPWRNTAHHGLDPDAVVFVDHWAAHQMVELSLGGAVVMESPN